MIFVLWVGKLSPDGKVTRPRAHPQRSQSRIRLRSETPSPMALVIILFYINPTFCRSQGSDPFPVSCFVQV